MSSQSSSNQKLAPICAEFVKQMREVFGEDQVKVLYVKENGLEIGSDQYVGHEERRK